NMLGPLVNPARPKYQMAGVFNLELARLYAYLFQQQPDKRFSVIHAMDGYDEISLTGSFKMKTQNSDVVLQPGDLGLKTLKPDEIYGGDTKEDAAAIFNQVLNGVATPAQMEVVYANAGIAIHTADPSLNLVDAVQKARESISNGQALSSFKNLLEATA
ncbi:MAG: anthranilate phosphoribosyltransferase, partial [Saprospiraceae bacterium]|nr:anthranilate phosphoribosyltransferase [Saprospiraceae bacterium]